MLDPYFPSIRRLAEYEIACNAKIIAAAQTLSDSQIHQHFEFGLGTIHETLWHIMAVLRWWSSNVTPELILPAGIRYDSHEPLADIARRNSELATAFLDAIDRSHAAGLLHLDRRIEQVFHLVTHGTHHRTQVITMFRLLGNDPPFEAGDFGGWSNTKKNPPATD